MKKSEIIKIFLDGGLQITNEALDFFIKRPEKITAFFSKPIHYPTTVTVEFIKKTLEAQPSIEVIKPFTLMEKASVEDFINFFNKRYTFFWNILSKHLDLVNLISINKVSEKTKKFSIIGMVKEKEKKNKTILVEDKSGEIELLLSEGPFNQLVEDETVGVVCERDDQVFNGQKIIFPDIPLQREINKTSGENNLFFISDIHMESELFNEELYEKLITWLKNQQTKLNIFILGDISSDKRDIRKFLSDIPSIHETHIIKGEIDRDVDNPLLPNPAFLQIENVKLFLFHNKEIDEYINFWNTPEQTLINLIKKRHLNPIFSQDSKIYDDDPYLLDIIPDIVVAAHTHIPTITNYKGITIVTTGSFVTQPIFWLINLRTRETFKIDFS